MGKKYTITEDQVTSYDDIAGQHIDRHFKTSYMRLPIASFPNIKLPSSYTDYTKTILATINPIDLSSRGTAIMIAQVFSDMITGGNLDISETNLNPVTKIRTSQAVLQSMIYGTAALVIFEDKISIKSPAEFYYDETSNIYYSATFAIVDNEDTKIYEKRYIKNESLFIEQMISTKSNDTKKVYEVVPYDDGNKSTSLGVQIFTNNEYNDDIIGLSVFHEVIPQIQVCEINMHEYTKSMLYTKPRLFLGSELIETDTDGNTNIDLVTDVIVTVDGLANDDSTNIIEPTQFKFDADAFSKKIQDDLASILSKVGMDRKILAWGGGNVEKSAREVDSEDNRMFARIEKYREFYTPQIINAIKLMNLDSDEILVRFLPLQYMNFSTSVQNVQSLMNSKSISIEKAVYQLYPRETDEQRTQEVERIKSQSVTKGTDIVGALASTGTEPTQKEIIADDVQRRE